MNNSISFVIPAFQAEGTIADAMRSVLVQQDARIELIVVDDGSTDATFARAAGLADGRTTLVRRTNRGVAASRNLGLLMARHEFVCFLDADDVLDARFAARTMTAIGECDAITTAYRDTNEELVPANDAWYPSREELRLERLRSANPLAIGATVFRTQSLHLVTRHFGEAFPSQDLVEDWELLLRFTNTGARWADPIEEPLMHCRLGPTSRSSQSRAVWLDGLALFERWVPCAQRSGIRRRWTLAQLARALANEQRELASEMMQSLGTLSEEDAPSLIGSLRMWAVRQRTRTGAPVSPTLIQRVAGSFPKKLNEKICSEVLAPSWAELALSWARARGPADRLVIYGYGANGRQACRALIAAGFTCRIVDDQPGFDHPRALSSADLRPTDAVLVTPDRRESILTRLGALGINQVCTVDSLAGGMSAAA
ncbi:MAG: glycosyltransferase family A protein [Phycisphaerales bacterium]